MPSVPPYSSTTTARWTVLVAHLATRGEHELGAGQQRARAAGVADPAVGRGVGGEQVADVQEAEDVVEAAALTG